MKSRAARRLLWLIAKHENGQVDVFTINPGCNKEALPVFSFEEEAKAFLELRAPGPGWRVKETVSAELISVLYGPCAGVRRVALDPLPAEIDGKMIIDLVSLSRERFVRILMGERGLRGRAHGQEIPDETTKAIAIPDYVMWDLGS